jgi:phosphoribosylformimino-5-aminoimidazole carboxamide ribotide isomerase
MDAGAETVIIGSAAVTLPGFLENMASKYPDKIAAGVDAKRGYMSIHGWRETADMRALDFLRDLQGWGVNMAVYTDIDRDGLLGGANISAYREAGAIAGLKLIASGGVSSEGDILALSALNIYGAIIGKAIYEKKIDLEKIIKLTEGYRT